MPRVKRVLKDKLYYRKRRKQLRVVLDLQSDSDSVLDLQTDNDFDYDRPIRGDDLFANLNNNCNSSEDILNQSHESTADDLSYASSDDESSSSARNNSDSDIDNSGNMFDGELAEWLCAADTMGLSREHANKLLHLLQRNGHPNLPFDSRTLTKRPRKIPVIAEEFVYFGIEKSLSSISIDILPKSDVLQLKIGIDGIPIHKDGKKMSFWPILISTEEIPPLVVAIWYGVSKPRSVDDYLHDFLEELQRLSQNGIIIHDRQFNIQLKCFICDAPARAFLKQIKGHNARQSCERCTIEGCDVNNVMCYISNNTETKRTDEGYINHKYLPDHQQVGKKSPLLDYNIGLVSKFPLDYMHLVCLGVMKRFLHSLTSATIEYRISKAQFDQIGTKLASFSKLVPSEFARRPRSLQYLDRFKAVELRQFLLYTGIVALKSIVAPDVYHTFLCLNVAFSILLNEDDVSRNTFLNYARDLLRHFVKNSEKIFGRSFVTYNVHNLLHIADDCENFRCALDQLSAFKFESFLYSVKKKVKHSNNALVQVSKSIEMERQLRLEKTKKSTRSHRLKLSTESRDCYFLTTTSHKLCIIKEVLDNKNSFLCDIVDDNGKVNYFNQPCESSFMEIYYYDKIRCHRQKIIELKKVWRKIVMLPVEKGGFVAIPLLHDGLSH